MPAGDPRLADAARVPVARAMSDRGHRVRWAVPPAGVERVEAAGVRAFAAGTPVPVHPNDVRARYPELDHLSPADVPDFLLGKLFGAIGAPAMLAGLEPVALEWHPDLVIADAAEFAGDPAKLGAQPPLVRVERDVLQSQLLARCHAAVSHAGSGTALAAARHGLPQLCLPQGADQFLNAAAIASSGAGLSLKPQDQTGGGDPRRGRAPPRTRLVPRRRPPPRCDDRADAGGHWVAAQLEALWEAPRALARW
jgi:hypothetical protein